MGRPRSIPTSQNLGPIPSLCGVHVVGHRLGGNATNATDLEEADINLRKVNKARLLRAADPGFPTHLTLQPGQGLLCWPWWKVLG